MNPQHKALLDKLPEKPERSKLAPYRDLIRALRQRRYTFREIANLLAAHYALKVDHTTIVDFTKRRRNQPPPLPLTTEHQGLNASPGITPAVPISRPTDQLEPRTPYRPYKRFHFDPNQGLTLSDEDLKLQPKKD